MNKYDWTDVRLFHEDQQQVDELLSWVQQNVQGVKVSCVLEGPNSIYVKDCLLGLHSLVNVVTTYRPAAFKTSRLLIGGIGINRIPLVNVAFGHALDDGSDTILIDYNDSPKEMYEQTVQR